MKYLLFLSLIVTFVKFSYQGEFLDLDPFYASYSVGTIDIPKYWPPTKYDQNATDIGWEQLFKWAKHHFNLDPLKRPIIGPLYMNTTPSAIVTMKNFVLSGFSNVHLDGVDVRVPVHDSIPHKGRVEINATFAEENISYDIIVDIGKKYEGHINVIVKNVELTTVTQVENYTKIKHKANIIGHSYIVKIPVFQIQLDFPKFRWIEDKSNLIQLIVNKVKPNIINEAGKRWLEDIKKLAADFVK